MRIVIALLFIAIIGAMAVAGRSMLKDGRGGTPKTQRMARALAWRVGLSLTLLLLVWLGHYMGWIQPTGLPVQSR